MEPTLLILTGVLMLGVFIFSMMPNRKAEKRIRQMWEELAPGDKVKTTSGVIGTIVEIYSVSENEKNVVIETGAGDNTSTITFDMMAIGAILEKEGTPEIDPDLIDEDDKSKSKK